MIHSIDPRQVETQDKAGRAMAALAIAIPITLSGKDANGVEFTEKTRTIIIDRRGGKIATKCHLTLGSEMTLHNPIVGQTASIRVIWVGEKRAAEEPREVGVQLLGSENIWGIDFPCSDRRESALQAPRPEIYGSQTPAGAASSPGPSAVLEFAVPDAGSPLEPAKTSCPAPSLAAATVQAPQPSPPPVAGAAPAPTVKESNASIGATLNRLIQPMETAGEDEARLLQEKAEEFSRSSGLPRRTDPPVTAKNFEESKSYEELETFGNDRIKRFKESLTKAEGEQQRWALSGFGKALEQECAKAMARMKSDLAQALQDVTEQAARQASALNDLRRAVEEESLQTLAHLKAAATQAIGEVSGQIERQANALKELCGEVQEESAKTLAQAKSEAAQAIRGVSEQVGREVEALNNLRNSLAVESAQALPKFLPSLEQLMGEVADQVEQQVRMLCSFLNLIERESAQVSSRVKNDVAQARAESSLLAQQYMKSTQAAFSDWEIRIGSHLESQLQQLEEKTRASLETLQEHSEELLKRTWEKLRSESQALPEQIEASLKEAAGNIEQNWLERIRGKQQQAADEILEASAAQLGKQLEENLDLFGEELKLKQEQAASGAAEAFRTKIVEMFSVSR